LLARQEGYEKPSGGLTPDQITRQMIGQSAYELPKDLATSGQAYDMKRGEVIAAFLKAIKDQKLNQADPAYASLASALSDKLAEMDAEWAKKNKSTGAEARPDFISKSASGYLIAIGGNVCKLLIMGIAFYKIAFESVQSYFIIISS
jgi:hypothetical protein